MAVVAIGALAAAAVIYVRSTGLSALSQPHTLEATAARAARRLAVPGAIKARPNPIPASADAIASGRAHFADHCASCHANDGSGNTEVGRNLFPKAPDMRQPETQALTDGELFWFIENGIRFTGMPGWRHGHTRRGDGHLAPRPFRSASSRRNRRGTGANAGVEPPIDRGSPSGDRSGAVSSRRRRSLRFQKL